MRDQMRTRQSYTRTGECGSKTAVANARICSRRMPPCGVLYVRGQSRPSQQRQIPLDVMVLNPVRLDVSPHGKSRRGSHPEASDQVKDDTVDRREPEDDRNRSKNQELCSPGEGISLTVGGVRTPC